MTTINLPLPKGKYPDAKQDLLHGIWDRLSFINGQPSAALQSRTAKGGYSTSTEDVLAQIVDELSLLALPLKNRLNETVNVLDFGADPTGLTDSTDAFEAAIAKLAQTSGRNGLYVPTGVYLITRTLDLTNTRSGSNFRDSICVFGDGIFSSQLIGKTGAGHAIMDLTGSQWAKVRDIQLVTDGTAGSSTLGIYTGVFASLTQTQNQVMERVAIFMHSDVTANGANGTIAYYNFGGEENTFDACFFSANRPLVLTGQKASPYDYAFPVHPLVNSHSLGVTTATGELFLQALGCAHPAVELIDVNSFSSVNLYIAGTPVTGVTQTQFQAITIRGGATNVNLRGTIEGFDGIARVYGRIKTGLLAFQMGGANDGTKALFQLEQGEGTISGSDILINLSQQTTRPLWNVTTTSANQIASSFVQDTTIRSNQLLADMRLPEKLIFNASTRNVRLQSANAPEYIYDSNIQRTAILRTQVRGFSGANATTRIATIQLPSVIAGTSAMSVMVRIEGTAGHNSFNLANATTLFWQGTLCLVTDANGNITVGTAAVNAQGGVAVNTSANNLTGMAMAGSISGNTVLVNLTPTVSGANNEAVYFVGTISLHWMGHSCNGPTLFI